MSADRDPSVPEPDEFDRLLMDLTSGRAEPARFREPSAAERARMAARARRSARAAGRRASRRLLRRALLRATSVLLVAALFGYAAYTLVLRRALSPAPRAGASPTATTPRPAPTSPASLVAPSFTLARPFAGTPADAYPSGAAGVVVPVAAPAGGYTTAQVAAAYASTRQLIIAAELDQPTLHGGRPRAFIALLTPEQRAIVVRGLKLTGVGKHGYARSTRSLVTSFEPGTTALVGAVIKVTGHMSSAPAAETGRQVLRVLIDYLFVYPVERPSEPVTRMRVVVHLTGYVDFAQWDSSGSPLQPWWLGSAANAGARCDNQDGYVYPEFPYNNSSPDPVRPSGTPIDPYSLSKLPALARCQAVTRT